MLFGTAWIGCHVDGYSFGHATLELHFPCNVGGARTRSCRTGRTSGPHGLSAGNREDDRHSNYQNQVLCFHTTPACPWSVLISSSLLL